jgi:hypothetical protein
VVAILSSLASDERPRHLTRTTSEVEAVLHQADTALDHLCDTLGPKLVA